MNTTSTVVSEAVQQHNEQLTSQVNEQAMSLIGRITDEQAKIAGAQERIAQSRIALDKMSKDVIDEVSVLGGSLPTNANRDTIAKVIELANKNRQFDIEQKSSRLVASITSEQDAIRSIEKRIAELRDQLAKLTPATVTVEQVLG